MESLKDYFQDEYLDVLAQRYKQWQERITDKELLEYFPEMKEVLPEIMAEQQQTLTLMRKALNQKLNEIAARQLSEYEEYIRKELVKLQYGEKIKKLERNIARNKRLITMSEGRKITGWIGDDEIHQAQQVPIQNLLGIEFKKSGKTLRALCPFHQEKNPSFYIYPETNTCWCFGCQQGGDSIKFVMLLHGFNFKQAVRVLLEGNV